MFFVSIFCFWQTMPSLPSIHALSSDDGGDKPLQKGLTLTPRQKVQRLVSRSASSTWEPVSDLTDDSSSHGADLKDVGVRKRKRRSRKKAPGCLTLREKLVSDVHCKATLGRICKGCKRPCLAVFQSQRRFSNFMDFRQKWKDMHKLDQDRVVLWCRLLCAL